ncbi:pyruvate/2-oxoglutarate dehydrogenase complex, dehydrogenase (E1) component, beta subunit [Streptococcus pneumoniae]|nr:pyruvate/2-oxoglutarate dehydrogenase complex, dehydrogenase (E1) component, beta subunit [Streptococcus pneumoniae]
METKTMSFRDTIILAMSEEMRRDENVFLMGEDVGVFGGDFGTSVGMLEEFGPERVRDCPISEAAISGAAAGAAMTGLRPIVDMTSWTSLLLPWTISSTKLLKHVTCLVVKVRFQ